MYNFLAKLFIFYKKNIIIHMVESFFVAMLAHEKISKKIFSRDRELEKIFTKNFSKKGGAKYASQKKKSCQEETGEKSEKESRAEKKGRAEKEKSYQETQSREEKEIIFLKNPLSYQGIFL